MPHKYEKDFVVFKLYGNAVGCYAHYCYAYETIGELTRFYEATDYNWENEIGKFDDGLEIVCSNRKFGLLDKTLREVIPLKYDYIHRPGNEGLIRAKLNGKWGYINMANKVVVPFKYDDSRGFSNGLAAVYQNGKWGYVNTSGTLVIPCKFYAADYFQADGLAKVKLNKSDFRYFYINKKGVKG